MKVSCLVFVAIILLARDTRAGKIIAVPLCGAPSHVFILWKVCRELTDRGHSVLVIPKGPLQKTLAQMHASILHTLPPKLHTHIFSIPCQILRQMRRLKCLLSPMESVDCISHR